MSGGGGAIKGYWYSLGIHMGICRGPVNSIVETRIGDKPMLKFFLEMDHSDTYPIYNPGLFGGTDGEGGIAGPYILMMGEPDQVCPPSLALMNYPTPQPGFRRIVSVFFDGLVSAISPYPKQWSFRVRRTTKGWDGAPWYPEKAMIELTRAWTPAEITSTPLIHAMNPAHIFYEVMTNREWGRGLPRAALDDANLRQVADTLFNEGFGLCLYWQRSDSVESFVQAILDHIGAVMRPNLTTGELQLKLLRKDYVVTDLPLFDNESGLLDITEASVAAMPTIINHVLVKFKDPITGKDASVGTHNLAGVQGSGGEINTMTKDYPGLPTPDLAARVALRDLRVSSSALRKFTVTLDRRGQKVQPGDVIRIRDYTRGIPETVMRVGAFEDGPHTDGRIKVTAVQDVFAMSATSFTGNQPPAWNGPNTSPCIGYNRSFEMPYFMLAHTMNAADLAFVGADAGYLGQVVELGGRPLNAGYKLAVRNGGATPDDIPELGTNFCPTVPAEWDGGDCVRVVVTSDDGVALEWVMTMGAPTNSEDPAYSDSVRGVLTAQSSGAFGTVSGAESYERFGQFLTNMLSSYWPEPFTSITFAGNADEHFTRFVFTYAGTDYEMTLTYDATPVLDGYDGSYTCNVTPNMIPLPAIGATLGVKIYQEGGTSTRVYEACCTCFTIGMTGVPVAPTPGGSFEDYLYEMNGLITTPDDVTNPNSQYPVWGPPYIDYSTTPDKVSDNSLTFILGPEDSGKLTSILQCAVYDDTDGGSLIYSTTLYKAGGTEGAGANVYLERAVADFTNLEVEYPPIHDAPGPTNPAAALVGHNLRFVLKTASQCCGGLPPEPTEGTPKFRISSLTSDGMSGFINTSVVDAAGVNGPWLDLTRMAFAGPGANFIFEVALVDDSDVPLPEADQPTWTGTVTSGIVTCLTNAAVGNTGGAPGASVFVMGGGGDFNRTLTLTSSADHGKTIAVHYPNPTITQTVASAYGGPPSIPGDPVFGSDSFGTGSIVSDVDGNVISADLFLTAVAHPYTCGKATVNQPFWNMGTSVSFAASGVDWIDDNAMFTVNRGGAAKGVIYYANVSVTVSGTDDGCAIQPVTDSPIVVAGFEGSNSTAFINFVGKDTYNGQFLSLPTFSNNPLYKATATIS